MAYYLPKKKQTTPKHKSSRSALQSAVKRLDKTFSLYIRLRDSKAFHYSYFRCISCGQVKPFEQADCGHYFSRTHMATRFDEDNCHAECSYCNRFKADHMIGYHVNLLKKIGKQRFDLLTLKAHSTCKWSVFELEMLIKHYKTLIAEMEKGKDVTPH